MPFRTSYPLYRKERKTSLSVYNYNSRHRGQVRNVACVDSSGGFFKTALFEFFAAKARAGGISANRYFAEIIVELASAVHPAS